ncbi:hypothetical protein V757_12770 [Pelistega indica]|uniref:Uncharacterized protein n=1 Tax=Pelistega indica TaxID=1414851 RepID=V8FRK8_9BURK|nr:PhaM family polyhydroxyalkanoate granule multifunctional regulatory protein [Pelistega indica]ETD66353.1 hypothetical protein V757_12770 [Pelistega indica]
MSDNKNLFEQLFSPDYFKQPFFGNIDAFHKAWNHTLEKNQQTFSSPEATIAEIDKRIEELKNVENWLSLNLSMLKNTIQGLELQKSNLTSFKEILNSNEALQAAGQQWWQSLQEQLTQLVQAQTANLKQTTPTTDSQQTVATDNSTSKVATTNASKPRKTAVKQSRRKPTEKKE